MSDDLFKGLVLGSPANPLVLCLSEYQGHRLIDIRKYFIERQSRQPKPTKKGVSLNATQYRQVMDVLAKESGVVLEWLDGQASVATVTAAMRERQDAVEREATKPRPIEEHAEPWRGPEFFRCCAVGGADEVTLNTRHPFAQVLESCGPELGKPGSPIFLLLAAYARAKQRFDGDIESDSDGFFAMLESEWGVLLSRYCVEREA